MRILKVTQAYHPFWDQGGPVVKVRSIATRLALRNHGVTVLTSDLGMEQREDASRIAQPTSWGWQGNSDGIETIYLRRVAHYRALTLNLGLIGFCRSRLKEFQVAHVYGLYDLLGPGVGYFCRRRGVPYVVETMGMFRPIIRNLWLKRAYHRLFGAPLIQGASAVIATSEQEKRELLEGGLREDKIVVRRNGIEAPASFPQPGSFRQAWEIPSESKLILFLGRLVAKKSPDLMLEAYAKWRQSAHANGESVLVLAGPSETHGYLQKLQAMAGRLGIQAHVKFTGPLYDDAKWAAYRDADVFVLPSQNENFGNTAAEAMASGTPVIVTDRCGIAPFVSRQAGLVIPHGAQQLQEALQKLLENESLRMRVRSRCAEIAKELSWDEPVMQMESLYSRLLALGSCV
jgi:glycosyltransferase involved in cell wall biosynthesis